MPRHRQQAAGKLDGASVDSAGNAERNRDADVQVRFIEYMPLGLAQEWSGAYVPCSEILDRIRTLSGGLGSVLWGSVHTGERLILAPSCHAVPRHRFHASPPAASLERRRVERGGEA